MKLENLDMSYSALVDCTVLDQGCNGYLSNVVDVGDGVKLQFKIPKMFRTLQVTPILAEDEKKIWGKLYVRCFGATYEKNIEFVGKQKY